MQSSAARPRKERKENAAKRRRQIIDATIESISRNGLSGTTLATVAELAGMSQGSTIFYFQTKDQLITEAFRAHCEDYRRAWMKVFETKYDNPIEHLMRVILCDWSKAMCNRREISLWFDFWGETHGRPQFRELNKEYATDRLQHLSILAERASDKMSDEWTVDEFANAVEALTDGLWLQLHMSTGRVIRRGARQQLAQFVASVFPSEREEIVALAERVR